ncbi:type VI secretion system Vgr family protein [Roseateles sp. BYS78W]|uniref:Type VI secretion system Vgr family protein n=1 Tax=Pelomonas candidula TaxID=3299025 RepID=A0ABW7HIM6_9BURK
MTPPPFTLNTPLGETLLFQSLNATEELGRLFEFNVLALAEAKTDVDLEKLLGKNAHVSIQLDDNTKRHLHGVIATAGLDGASGGYAAYRLTLRPWLWLATLRADTRIFQNIQIDALIKKVLQPYGGDIEFNLQGSYPTFEYCVQYRESDFNFVSRLMEQEGLYYYFKHSDSKHTLVVVDKMSAHQPFPDYDKFKFRQGLGEGQHVGVVSDWRHHFELQSAKTTLNDYNYLTPGTALLKDSTSMHNGAPATLEVYDPPGEYLTVAEGQRYAKLRMEEADARYAAVTAKTNLRGVATGCTFSLTDHPRDAENAKYLIVSTRIDVVYSGYEAGQKDSHFSCSFSAMSANDVFRSQRLTPKPHIGGTQSAVVVGPSGEEIYTDEHGRIKVQFHWDRLGKKDENSSCWLRVATPVAGKAWGMIALPRIGQEVVVQFVEGDPDRPLVLGSVYNAEQIPPYLLPDHATVSTFRSRSSKQGVAANFNELAFEDKKGEEYIRLHAEKDLLELVKNDAHLEVGNDQYRMVAKNLTEEIGENVARTIGKSFTDTIAENVQLTIGQDTSVDIGGKHGVKTGADASYASGASISVESSAGMDIKVGANLHIKAGANVVIEAGATLTLKGAMINIEGSGPVSITGAMVKVNSGGGGGGGSASPKSPDKPEKAKKPEELPKFKKKVADDLGKKR